MDEIKPFIHYVASKYTYIVEDYYEHEILFDVEVCFPGDEYTC